MTILKQVYQNQLQKENTINEIVSSLSIAGIFGWKGGVNSLTFSYYGGRYQKQDGTQGDLVDGSISLTDNTINYIYFNLQDEVVEKSVVSIPINCFPIAKITTASGLMTEVLDYRVIALYANGTPTNLSYTLPNASTTQLGGIMVDGITCSVDGAGLLSVAGGSLVVAKTSTTQSNNTLVLSNITDLVADVVANSVYEVDAFITFQSAATTTGLNLGFDAPASSICNFEVVVPITSTAVSTQLRTTFPNALLTNTGEVKGTGVTAINSNHTARITGLLSTGGTAGQLLIKFCSEVNASAITIQSGSILKVKKIA
jgi:hypothetical protein